MAWPATRTVIEMKDTSNPDITVKATGYQWKWGYDYLQGEGEGIRFLSSLSTPREQIEGGAPKGEAYLLEVDRPLVVPVGKKVRVLLTANDVIHSWWVPAFGVKQDAIPGFIRDTWFRADKEGVLPGQLCRAVRPRSRLHADRGPCAVGREVHRVGTAAGSGGGCGAGIAGAAVAGPVIATPPQFDRRTSAWPPSHMISFRSTTTVRPA
ncbi:hypothetical protein [Thauera sp. SDU_THAU2]|uniref:hypothetical protein n=1 Tax=Thauera sp. SDU_THAU2 TaxID=3136633 RepID=UPI0040550CEA